MFIYCVSQKKDHIFITNAIEENMHLLTTHPVPCNGLSSFSRNLKLEKNYGILYVQCVLKVLSILYIEYTMKEGQDCLDIQNWNHHYIVLRLGFSDEPNANIKNATILFYQ